MKLLVTGGSGFLGRHLVKKLKSLGHDVVSFSSKEVDLTEKKSLHQFNTTKFDRIYHLAAWTQAGDFCLYHPGEQWLINQQLNTNVLIWWKEHQSQAKFISMGTSCSYEEGRDLSEENYLEGKPIQGLYTYGMCKRMLHIGQQSLHKQFGLNYLTLVPSTLYGPGYHTDERQLHFIFDLIRKSLDFKYKNIPVVLWGNGSQRRELVFIDDFIRSLLDLSDKVSNDLVNIGAGEDYSIKEFIEKIFKFLNLDTSKVQYDLSKYVGAKSKMLSVKKHKDILGYTTNTSLDEGLKSTIEWMETTFYKH